VRKARIAEVGDSLVFAGLEHLARADRMRMSCTVLLSWMCSVMCPFVVLYWRQNCPVVSPTVVTKWKRSCFVVSSIVVGSPVRPIVIPVALPG